MTYPAPLMHGETIIGAVEVIDEFTTISPEDQVLIIRLDKQSGLVKELMKEELITFDIHPNPAVRS